MLTVCGTITLDTIQVGGRTLTDVLGGSASYAAASAGLFTRTGLVGVVGSDLPAAYRRTLARRASLDGITVRRGRTYRYSCRYGGGRGDPDARTTLGVDLSIIRGLRPVLPDAYSSSRHVFLANYDPDQSMALLGQLGRQMFSMCDTVDYWIRTKRRSVMRMFGMVDMALLNDAEARQLAGDDDLAVCARTIRGETGVPYLAVKRGRHGSLLFHDGGVITAPAYMLERVADPTGAGDAFAGGIIGHVAAYSARGRRPTLRDLRRAVTYGTVMGALTAEGYGMSALLKAARSGVERRARRYADGLPVWEQQQSRSH